MTVKYAIAAAALLALGPSPGSAMPMGNTAAIPSATIESVHWDCSPYPCRGGFGPPSHGGPQFHDGPQDHGIPPAVHRDPFGARGEFRGPPWRHWHWRRWHHAWWVPAAKGRAVEAGLGGLKAEARSFIHEMFGARVKRSEGAQNHNW